MKTCTKRIATALLALLVLLSGILALTVSRPQKADANAAEAATAPIYYFTDYYPTVSQKMLDEATGGNIVIDLDHQYVNAELLEQLVSNQYFAKRCSSPVAVIDIKTFMPESKLLEALFQQLRSGRIAFVSAYDQAMFPDLGFMNYIDRFICDSEMVRLNCFIVASLEQFSDSGHSIIKTAYLIDRNLIPLHTERDWDQFRREGIVYLFRYSPFLRHLVWDLCSILRVENLPEQNENEGHLTEKDYMYYVELAEILYGEPRIRFLSCLRDNLYVDLLTGQLGDYRDFGGAKYLCAFGFWRLDQASYDSWWDIRHKDGYNLPIYVLVVDDIQYNPNGLEVITDAQLEMEYPVIYDRRDVAALELMEFLLGAI